MMLEHEEVLILRTEASGESFLKLHVLSPRNGLYLCMKRISKKANTITTPDLFDTATLQLETSQHGTAKFVKEYQLIERRERIGLNYRSLQNASELTQLLVTNGAHLNETEMLYGLVTRALDAFTLNKAPEIVLLKSIYLILKDEGYAVIESWWPSLPTSLKGETKRFINEPTPERVDNAQKEACSAILQNLIRWMHHSTDWKSPE